MKQIFLFILGLLFALSVCAQDEGELYEKYLKGPEKDWTVTEIEQYNNWIESRLMKPTSLVQTVIMNGNKITTELHNYGSISRPLNRITDIVWNGLGYGYEFGPLFGAEVEVISDKHPDTILRIEQNGDTTYLAHIISDGLRSRGGELNPDATKRWQFLPLVSNEDGTIEYLTLESDEIPTNDALDLNFDGKPDSWPQSWYNQNIEDYVWPGALGQGATNADKEAFFVIDDRDNAEFDYYPFANDSSRRGLGLEIEERVYQWVSPLAEDAIFLIYKISNKSDKDLNKVEFGMWGDPHIGGPSDYNDDWAFFDLSFNMVFAFDKDGESDIPGRPPGYLGYKFLESPGIGNEIISGIYYPGDGLDNDNDGMIDESWTDGIDNDGDWDVDKHDTGIDGILGTGDLGEGDGIPTAGIKFDITKPGEPNFEFSDIDESDMIGLTGFVNPLFGAVEPSDDEKLYSQFLNPGTFDTSEVNGDRVFMYSSGRFTFRSLDTKRFSIALLMGEDLTDLKLNAITVQKIYNSGYQFAKPPEKPNLTIVPGDRKVILYWDDIAEYSYDPTSEEVDFEGYVIYRSTNHEFSDQQVITDINGSAFLFEPLKTSSGALAKFDLDNEYQGLSNTSYPGRGIAYYLGDNTGLVHTFIDSNNVYNGQTYFYALVSYDHGSDSLEIPPSECSKIITYNPTTNVYKFDVNTARVIPRTKAAGYIPPEIENYENNNGIIREKGTATGVFTLNIIDESAVEDSNKFFITFTDSTGEKTFSVQDVKIQEKIFKSKYNNFISIGSSNLDSVLVTNISQSESFIQGVDYTINSENGSILVFDPDSVSGARMLDKTDYKMFYTYFPIYQDTSINGTLSTPVFDGMRITVEEKPFNLRLDLTGWSTSSQTDLLYTLEQKTHAANYPADYEITFSSQIIDSSMNALVFPSVATPFSIWNVTENRRANFIIIEPAATRDSVWDVQESFIVLADDNWAEQTWTISFDTTGLGSSYNPPTDGDVFYLATDKPFSEDDLFSFSTKKAKINLQKAKSDLDYIRVVPNPYVATNIIEPRNTISRNSRGYRRLYFDKLPTQCTIRIYTTTGELVKTLEHNSTIGDGKEFWDLLTKDNMEVAYGLYFYHVDAPGIGEKMGKFAIIK